MMEQYFKIKPLQYYLESFIIKLMIKMWDWIPSGIYFTHLDVPMAS